MADEQKSSTTTETVPDYAEPGLDGVVHIGFWQKSWVQNVLPFATSLALHLGIIAVGFVLWQAPRIIRTVVQEQIIVPDATIVDGAEVGGIPNPGLGGDPTQSAAQSEVKDVSNSSGWSNTKSENLSQQLMGGGGSGASESVIGAVGGSGPSGGKGSGIGSGSGEGGGAMAPFGVPGGGGGAGPKSPFMGISGNARKVVYLCDASGSMMGVFGSLKFELKKAIDVLKPIQFFNVIFFGDGEVTPLNPGGLISANPDNKRKAYTFCETFTAAGGTNPIPAIQAAFKQKPELIYVLTDGFDNVASFQDVVNEFRKQNVGNKVKVNTILIGSTDQKELVTVLKTIATENGGVLKVVGKNDF